MIKPWLDQGRGTREGEGGSVQPPASLQTRFIGSQNFYELQCERRAFQACPIWNCSAFWSGSLLSANKYSMTVVQ